ncbi:hypothetical protein [Pseudoalteromonas sp. S1727]|nr:hypothetical protein [Pseudoalteromonas sp. S1727]
MMQLKQNQQRQRSEEMCGILFAVPSLAAKSTLLVELEICNFRGRK